MYGELSSSKVFVSAIYLILNAYQILGDSLKSLEISF